jgi:Primase C terminal 2 (PriCT-2)
MLVQLRIAAESGATLDCGDAALVGNAAGCACAPPRPGPTAAPGCLGLRAWFGGEALAQWDAWCGTSIAKWSPGWCEAKWRSFNGSGVTGGSIFALAEQDGYVLRS